MAQPLSTPDYGSTAAEENRGLASVPSWQNRVALGGVALVLLSLVVRYIALVQARAMEFDQFCTLVAAETHSWHAYVAAATVDSQPPFSHLAARIGLMLPVRQSIGVHIFSALAIVLTVLCLFRVFYRRGAPLAGLCAAALFTSSRCVEFMYTLRPYAALMAVSALSVLVYDTYRLRRNAGQRATLWPLALVIVLAATVHALSLVYVLAPIAAGELLYVVRTRRVDVRLLVATGLASTAFVFDFALAREIQTKYMSLIPLSARLPGRPTLEKLHALMTFPVERHWQQLLFLLVIVATVVFGWRDRRAADGGTGAAAIAGRSNADAYPLAAAVALYLAAIVAFCMGVVNHYFYTRYASPVYVSGALVLGALLATAPWRRRPLLPAALAAVLLVLPLPALFAYLHAGAKSVREDYAAIFSHGAVVGSPLAYPTLWWYATPDERQHMQMVTDADRYRSLPDGLPEVNLQRFAQEGVLPFALTQLRDYHPGKDVYLVKLNGSGDTWLPAWLEQQGYLCGADASVHSDSYALVHCKRGM